MVHCGVFIVITESSDLFLAAKSVSYNPRLTTSLTPLSTIHTEYNITIETYLETVVGDKHTERCKTVYYSYYL